MARKLGSSPFLNPVRPFNAEYIPAPIKPLAPIIKPTPQKNSGLFDGIGSFFKNIDNVFNESIGGVGSQAEYASNIKQLKDAQKALADYKSGKRTVGDKINSFLGMPATDYAGQVKAIQGDIQNYQKSLPTKQAEQAKINKNLPGVAKVAADFGGGLLGFGGKLALMNQMGGGAPALASKIPGSLSTSSLIADNAAGQALRTALNSGKAAQLSGLAAMGPQFEAVNSLTQGENPNLKKMALGAVEFPAFGAVGGAAKGAIAGAGNSALKEYLGRAASGLVQGTGFTAADSLANTGKLPSPKDLAANAGGMALMELASGGKFRPNLLDNTIVPQIKPNTFDKLGQNVVKTPDYKINPISPKLDLQNAPLTPKLKPLNINTPTDQIKSPLAENMASDTAKLNDVPLDMGPLSKKLIPMNLENFSNFDNKLPDTTKQIVSKTDRTPINVKGVANEAYIKSIDDLYKLNHVDKVAQDVLGRPLKANESMYKLGQNTRNANVIANEIATKQFVGSDLQKIGDGFSSITKQIPKGLDKQFEDYLIHKHAPSWTRLDRKIFPDNMGVTRKVSNLKVSEYEKAHPEFKKIAQQFYDFRDKLAQEYLVKPGIISKESYATMKEKYPNYVPLRRQMDENTQPLFNGPKRGFANQTNPVKKAVGSERPIISPIESTIEDIGRYVNTAKRNEVMQVLIKNMQKDPEAFSGLAEIVKAPKENMLADINKTLQDEGIDGLVNSYNRQFDEVFSKRKTGGDNTVTGLVGGNRVHVKVNDPQLLEALTNLTPEARGVLVNSVGKITGVMKALTTGVNPVFSLARNIFRDVPTAYINSPSTNNPLRFGVDLLHSFGSTLADTLPNSAKNKVGWVNSLAKLHQEYKAAGGGHSSPLSANRNLLAESKSKALPGYYDLKHPLRTTGRIGKQGLNTIGKLNDAIESAPRMGEFKRIAKPGDYASKVEGIYQANDVTVNFNKRGKWGKEVDAVVPYLNAALQGLDKLGRQFKENPVKTSAKAFLSVTVPAILLYSINHKNPNYQKLNDYTKDNYFLIPRADGTFYKIPKPREVGVMFGSSVERALRQWNDNDPKGFENFSSTIWSNFLPP